LSKQTIITNTCSTGRKYLREHSTAIVSRWLLVGCTTSVEKNPNVIRRCSPILSSAPHPGSAVSVVKVAWDSLGAKYHGVLCDTLRCQKRSSDITVDGIVSDPLHPAEDTIYVSAEWHPRRYRLALGTCALRKLREPISPRNCLQRIRTRIHTIRIVSSMKLSIVVCFSVVFRSVLVSKHHRQPRKRIVGEGINSHLSSDGVHLK
jgi:hypothetical protein